MVSTKLYTAIYVALFVSATVQVLVEFAGLAYWTAFGIIIVLSVAKAAVVAAYFQHLRFEPRSLTYLVELRKSRLRTDDDDVVVLANSDVEGKWRRIVD